MAVRRRGLASGPICVPSARPSPTFRPCACLTSACANSFLMLSCTRKRVGEMQTWPALRNLARAGGLDGQRDVGVLGDDHRRVAAQFHRHALHVLAGQRGQLLAHRRRAGEGDLADDRVRDQVVGDVGRVAVHQAQHAGAAGPRRRRRGSARPATPGVSSAALTIIEQPVASAAASLRTTWLIGKFQGVNAATGPTGSFSTIWRTARLPREGTMRP